MVELQAAIVEDVASTVADTSPAGDGDIANAHRGTDLDVTDPKHPDAVRAVAPDRRPAGTGAGQRHPGVDIELAEGELVLPTPIEIVSPSRAVKSADRMLGQRVPSHFPFVSSRPETVNVSAAAGAAQKSANAATRRGGPAGRRPPVGRRVSMWPTRR